MAKFRSERSDFLEKGTRLLKEELDEAVEYTLGLQKHNSLTNVDILSDNIIADGKLQKRVVQKVKAYSSNFEKLLYATASYVEEQNFSTVDEAMSSFDLAKLNKSKLKNLILVQKRLSFSFQTLNLSIEMFSRINADLLDSIREAKPESNLELTKLMLKNAVLVYELTNFVARHIEKFGLVGVDELKQIRSDVFEDLNRQTRQELELQRNLETANQAATREMIANDISNRQAVRKVVRQKWNEFFKKINDMQDGVDSAKKIVTDLYLIRDNAKNQLDLLQVIATTQIVESNLEIVKNLSHIKNFALAPLTPEDAARLLGINIIDSKKTSTN